VVDRTRRVEDKPRILVIEDDRTSRLTLGRHLAREGYAVSAAETGEEGWGLLQEDPHRLVLLDWNLPGIQGSEVCRLIRTAEQDVYTYIIILTSNEDRESLLEAFDAGADDYMTKPFERLELKARLRVAERLLNFHARMKESEKKLRDLAEKDGLTKVLNRRALQQRLEDRLRDGMLGSGSVGFLMADIDFFKRVNDTYGHLAGDEVLRQVGARIRDSIRTSDDVGRYGGEEFGIVVPGASEAAISAVTQRVWNVIRTSSVPFEDEDIAVTVSIGAAVGDPGTPVDELLGEADAALYQAKREGRDRVVFRDGDRFRTLYAGEPLHPGFSGRPAALNG
jgi:two-component system chemotaxis response regulator CheY